MIWGLAKYEPSEKPYMTVVYMDSEFSRMGTSDRHIPNLISHLLF